jgi:hypothetical protein
MAPELFRMRSLGAVSLACAAFLAGVAAAAERSETGGPLPAVRLPGVVYPEPADTGATATAPKLELEGRSNRAQGASQGLPVFPHLRSVRRPFLLMWKSGRDEVELGETDIAPLTAAQLVIDYLNYWSAPNVLTLVAMPDFYAPKVLFHGRVMSARALTEEKRRFVQRWPNRNYVPRLGTMRTTCNARAKVCTVRTTFDFTAGNPEQGTRSQGRAALELGVNIAGERPVIVFETSQVIRREGSRQMAGHQAPRDATDPAGQ